MCNKLIGVLRTYRIVLLSVDGYGAVWVECLPFDSQYLDGRRCEAQKLRTWVDLRRLSWYNTDEIVVGP